MNWFEENTILIGYLYSEAPSSVGQSMYQSSLALMGIDLCGEKSFQLNLLTDLADPACDRQPSDEIDKNSCNQKYFIQHIKEW